MQDSYSSLLEVPRGGPLPQSQLSRPTPPPSSSLHSHQASATRAGGRSQSSSLLRIIAVAICLVLAFHWYLILHHLAYHAPRGHFGRPRDDGHSKDGRRDDGSNGSFFGWEDWGGGIYNSGGGSGEEDNDGRYILSPICGGCYRAYDDGGAPCHDLVQQYTQKHPGISEMEASVKVGRMVGACGACASCHHRMDDLANPRQKDSKYQTKYWRFDQTSPRYTSPTSLVLSSIPPELRVPPSRYEDIEAYIKTKYANPDPENTTNVFLMEYNPGVAPIPIRMRAYLPWNARYLLSLRVTPHNFCFPLWLTDRLSEDQKQTMHSLNHMGLALLDDKYEMISGHDVVIDIDRQLEAKRDSYMGEPAFVDYRLFTLNDELYLHINSDTVILTKLRLRSKGIGDPNDKEADSMLRKMGHKPIKLNNLYGGDQFQVTLLHQFNTIWGEGKKSVFGKNYALFSIPNTTHPNAPDSVYAEMSVHPDHMVQQILPDEYDKLPRDRRIKWRQRRNFKIDYIIQRKMRTAANATVSSSADAASAAVPSFFTADEHWFPGSMNPFKEFAHGGACCVSLSIEEISQVGASTPDGRQDANWEGVDSILVGVGHTLVKFYNKNKMPAHERMLMPDTNYVSFLYAFDPKPPFQLLARSGYFCLGFALESEEEEGGTINPRSVLTRNRPLQQNNETFACAQIHYVSTIIEKLDDPSSTIVGYGMNDCTARLVEVPKSELAKLLFPDPWDMVLSRNLS